MSAIVNQWIGDGVANGTTVTAGNINTAGNGSTVTYNVSGSPTSVYEGHGYRVTPAATSDIARLDAGFSATSGLRAQIQLTAAALPGVTFGFASARNSVPANAGQFVMEAATGRIGAYDSAIINASRSPATAAADKLLIDMVWALHSSPTTSNGRLLFRVTNLTNPTWNTTGTWFWDSGYTLNLGVAQLETLRAGFMNGGTAGQGILYEYIGWEPITVSTSDTSQAQASAYFADAPSEKLPTPSITSVNHTDATSGNNGTVTIAWTATPGAATYQTQLASGTVTSGFSADTTGITGTSQVYTGLAPGNYTGAVRAMP